MGLDLKMGLKMEARISEWNLKAILHKNMDVDSDKMMLIQTTEPPCKHEKEDLEFSKSDLRLWQAFHYTFLPGGHKFKISKF